MTYEIYRYIFIGGAILAGVMLITSVLLFFILNIPHVVGDLTGRNAKKAIENIRNQNESSDDTLYKTSEVNRERGKITDKIATSSFKKDPSKNLNKSDMVTEKNITQELSYNETTVLDVASETTVLNDEGGETTVLDVPTKSSLFQIEYEITYIHTQEVIA